MPPGTRLNAAGTPGDFIYDEDVSSNTTVAAGSNNVSLPTGTINVASTAGFASAGTVEVTTSFGVQLVAYTGLSGGNQFTGCTGGSGVMTAGGAITDGLKIGMSGLMVGASGSLGTRVSTVNPLPVALAVDVSAPTQNITVIDSGSTGVAHASGQVLVTGTPTVNSAATFALASIACVTIQVTGTWTGNLYLETSRDGGTTYVQSEFRLVGPQYSTTYAYATDSFIGEANVAGCTHARMRARVNAVTGTATVLMVESRNPSIVFVDNAASGDTRWIFNNATLTTSGSMVLTGLGGSEVSLGIITGAATGTTPSLTVTMAELDPVGQVSTMTSPGNTTTLGPFTTSTHSSYSNIICNTGAVLVTWTITGTTPSFANCDLWVTVRRAQTFSYGLNGAAATTVLPAIAIDAATSAALVVGTVAAGGAIGATSPVMVAGSDGANVRRIFTDASGNQQVVGTVAAAGAIGATAPVMCAGSDGANVRRLLTTATGVVTTCLATGVQADRAVLTAGTADGLAIMGQSSGVGRLARMDRMAHLLPGFSTLLFEDPIEGAAINPLLWTSSTATMTIAQSAGLLTLNANATTTTTTDAIITSIKQFPIGRNQAPLSCTWKQNVSQTTNAVQEFGFGAPAGTTALVGNAGAFVRVSAGAVAKLVVVYNGTETTSGATATLVTTTYYLFHLWIEDGQARLVIESSAGTPLLDTQIALPIGSPGIGVGVSHLPIFSRVYTSGAAGAAPKTNIAAVQVWQWDQETNKSWPHQLASFGRVAGISPTTFLQTQQWSPSAAPGTTTPTTNASAYSTLGGEYSLNVIAGAENALGVFAYQVPAPYSLAITDIEIPTPIVTTIIGATAVVLEFAVAIVSAAVAANPSLITTANAQVYPLGFFVAAATAAVGSLFSGAPISLSLQTPIVAQPGQYVLVLVKQTSGVVTTGGVYRGSVLINGYPE